MSSPFVAEIRIVGFNFAPHGWATCDGQLLPIAQNTALFSLLGTQYGGNGTSNFALPDLRGRAPLFWGQGAGLSQRVQGETGGTPTATVLSGQLPVHSHTDMGLPTVPNPTPLFSPAANVWAVAGSRRVPSNLYAAAAGVPAAMNTNALTSVGGNQPHNNMPPYLCMMFVIAMQGIFPPRS